MHAVVSSSTFVFRDGWFAHFWCLRFDVLCIPRVFFLYPRFESSLPVEHIRMGIYIGAAFFYSIRMYSYCCRRYCVFFNRRQQQPIPRQQTIGQVMKIKIENGGSFTVRYAFASQRGYYPDGTQWRYPSADPQQQLVILPRSSTTIVSTFVLDGSCDVVLHPPPL